jgi:hypothetical protein
MDDLQRRRSDKLQQHLHGEVAEHGKERCPVPEQDGVFARVEAAPRDDMQVKELRRAAFGPSIDEIVDGKPVRPPRHPAGQARIDQPRRSDDQLEPDEVVDG